MYRLERTQIFNLPIEKVFSFFQSPENLEVITPDELSFKIKTPKPLIMKEGAVFDYKIKLGFIPFPWKTLITKYNPPFVFQDIQTFGPYKKWEHTHEFIDLGDKTKMIDTVEYDLFPKFLRSFAHKLYVKNQVEKIFDHRYEILENMFSENKKLEEIYQ
ncbi:MAG: SRPBCC family protein [Ignavibacteriae bacterium]|nr:SRPBCC family protein [Ignavibacteriota bacterium]